MRYLQKIGKSLMLPVAVLPAAALLMGIAYAIQSIQGSTEGADIMFFVVVAKFMSSAGNAIIGNLPVLFAIGLAFGLSKGQSGAAALAGFVAYTTVVVVLTPSLDADTNVWSVFGANVSELDALAFKNINNALTGILSGIIASMVYNKFHRVTLPVWISFFNGKRLVPIMTSLIMLVYVVIMFFAWPIIFAGLVAFGNWMVGLGAFGAGLFGFFNRLLIPTGLHHALNNVFWFDTIGIGDLTNFLKGQEALDAGTARIGVTGMYQAGFFPVMMFGLPGAALAFIMTAKPQNKDKVKGIMISAAMAAFLVGITEPLEFAFMFAAPLLYGVHCVLTGISLAVATLLQATAGFGFSAGAIDLGLSFLNPIANNTWMLLVMGVVYFFLYFFVFKILIVKLDIKTPGREDDEEIVAVQEQA